MKKAWAVLTSLIALGIAIAIFHKADSDYQKIVFSLLVIIYLRIAVFEAWNHIMYYEALAALGKDFWGIKKLLQEEKDGFKEFGEGYEVEMAKAEKDMDKVRLRVYIETGISSITFFIALYHLLRGLQIF
jgi:hypothetical protein